MDIATTIISGIISGVLASGIISILLFKMKPRLSVSGKLCLDPSDGRHRVKVVNGSRFNLLDVKYTMRYCSKRGDGIIDIQEIPPEKSPIETIDRYSASDPDSLYAIRLTYDLSGFDLGRDSYFEFSIRARHSLSGAVAFVRQVYLSGDVVEGLFETRRSMNILR